MENKKKKNGGFKLIFRYDKDIAVWSDRMCFMVTTGKDRAYLADIGQCFQEIFDYLVKNKLAKNEDKSIQKIAESIGEIKKELWQIIKPFTDCKL